MSDIAYLCSSLHVRLNHYFKSVIHAEHCTDAEKDLPLDKEQADDVIESFRQLATRSVRNHTAMLHPADRRIVSQLTQKIEALTRNISAAREVINTQTLQLEDQQNRIKEASSANDRMKKRRGGIKGEE